MPQRLGSAVDCEMLRCGDDPGMHRVISLQAAYERYGEPSCQKRVFAVGFLPSAPARITENVDVGRPDRESRVAGPLLPGAQSSELRACLGGDRRADRLQQ